MTFITYDIECYPNVFTLAARGYDLGEWYVFEISDRCNHSVELCSWIDGLSRADVRMVGFNNLGYDYPLLHYLYMNRGRSAAQMYEKSTAIINCQNRFEHLVPNWQHLVPQVDLYKIHHFDNVARSTSLKMIEFNMRSHSIEDLPFPPGTVLTPEEIPTLIHYNQHDVAKTEEFLGKTLPMIEFRDKLSKRYGRDFTNHNDTKIGKDSFLLRLKAAGIQTHVNNKPRQTPRPQIHLCDAIFPYIRFGQVEFQRVHAWLKSQTITETKSVFKNLSATVGGITFDFGTGGIHGSVESTVVQSNDEWVVLDLDVASYYPNLAIANNLYPEHLSEKFCEIYRDTFEERKKYEKGTPENAMLKLALNGVYGDSNNPYSPFFDPLYTMRVTINGQLLLCMLAEWLMNVPRVQMVQINTDGLTIRVRRDHREAVAMVASEWERFTGLTLETAEYNRMFIRDVNNYSAEYTDGKVKRKGAYEYEREWHQNHSSLVVAKAAESCLFDDIPVEDYIHSHSDRMDFMLRTKVPRTSYLFMVDGTGNRRQLQNTTRYYVSKAGGSLKKVMPPLAKKPGVWREIGICVGWKVVECNNMDDAIHPIDYDYYIAEAKKLTECFSK